MRRLWVFVGIVVVVLAGVLGCGRYKIFPSAVLTIVSAYGEPNPSAGTYYLQRGETVTATCGVIPYPSDDPQTGTRYICTGYAATGSGLAAGTDTTVTFAITEDTTITWQWRTEHKLSVEVEPAGAGSVTVVGGGDPNGYHAEGDTVELQATAAAGFSFLRWEGDASGTDNPLTVTMDAPKSVKAVFTDTLAIATTDLPEGEVDVAYNAVLQAAGGSGSYTWSDVNGTLAKYGLTLDASTGRISGTPTQATGSGGVVVTVEVSDGVQSASVDLTLIIWPQLTITTAECDDAVEGKGYTFTLQAAGGRGAANYVWSLASGGLPAGLSLSPDGTITGTPAAGTAGQTYAFVACLTDGIGRVYTPTLTVRVYAPLEVTTALLADAVEGAPYDQTLTATGGTGVYHWSLNPSGDALPAGLTLDASTGRISGTPQTGTAGTYNLVVAVSDSGNPPQTTTTSLTLTVQQMQTPVADFEVQTLSGGEPHGLAPLAVRFIDRSQRYTETWAWDFDDDGKIDSTEQNPLWTYTQPGWYTVRLFVSNAAGTDSCVKERCVLVVAGHIYYVDDAAGDDGNSGLSWSDAFKTISKALDVADDYDLVYVADGTYSGPSNRDLDFAGKKIYLLGVAYHTAGQKPVIDCEQLGRAFYFHNGETADAVVDNFTIQNGKEDGNAYPDTAGGAILIDVGDPMLANCTFDSNYAVEGGAIYCEGGSHPKIQGCVFTQNSAYTGGAIYVSYSAVDISECTFQSNSVSVDGGAIFCKASNATINNCTFTDNKADSGGGLRCEQGSVVNIGECVFTQNKATAGDGGGVSSLGTCTLTLQSCDFDSNRASAKGGAVIIDSSGTAKLTDCTFTGNRAGNHGGAVTGWTYSNVTVIGGTFKDNTAQGRGGAIGCLTHTTFEITNCSFDGNISYGGGGAVYCTDSSDLTMTDCSFTNNKANTGGGGALRSYQSDVSATDCTFQQNEAVSSGGGAMLCDGGNLTLERCQVIDNRTDREGGALYCADVVLTLKHSTFTSNRCAEEGGAVFCSLGSCQVRSCEFSDNHANTPGGAFYLKDLTNGTVASCLFKGNEAYQGGAIYTNGSTLHITSCKFIGNTTQDDGGALYLYGPGFVVNNSLLTGNHSSDNGGAIYCRGSTNNTNIVNCTFYANSADDRGGAFYCYGGSQVAIFNSIFWDDTSKNGGSEIHNNQSSPGDIYVDYCCVAAGGYGGETGMISVDSHCTSNDPQFVDEQGPDGQPGTGDEDLHVTAPSCVDKGSNSKVVSGTTTDLSGKPRIVDGDNDSTATVDIGCYEKQ